MLTLNKCTLYVIVSNSIFILAPNTTVRWSNVSYIIFDIIFALRYGSMLRMRKNVEDQSWIIAPH